MNAKEKTDVLTEKIDEAIEELAFQLSQGHTKAYLDMLDWYAHFHKYSIGNSMLIKLQCPHATLVAGFKRWQELGFTVKKGECGIAIRAPWLKKVPDPETGELVEKLIGYWPTYVFDISQTQEYPDKQPPDIYAPIGGNWAELYDYIKLQVLCNGIIVSHQPMPRGVQGMYWDGHICIADRLPAFWRITTIIHEYVHNVAHGPYGDAQDLTLNQREWEAESVTYAVCVAIGIRHDVARDYLLHYQFTNEDLHAAVKRIQALTKRVIKELRLAQEVKVWQKEGTSAKSVSSAMSA